MLMKRKLNLLGFALLLASMVTNLFAFDATKTYTIVNRNDASLYVQDNSTGGISMGGLNKNSYWMFEATAKTNCYYVKNAVTGKYAQSCNSNETPVQMGDTPVEYYIELKTEEGDGMYGLASTDQTTYNFTSGTIGWNWKNDNTVQGFAAAAGTNHRSFWKIVEAEMPAAVTLSSPWTGTNVAEGDFYLYNVESGLWLQNNDSKSEDWSTRAAIGTRGFEWHLVASEGAYALQPNFYINGQSNMCWSINPGNNYIDTGDGKAWEFHAYDAMRDAGISNAFTINNGEYVLGTVKYNEGARQNNLFTQEGDERWYLENPDYNKNMSERITWQLVTKAERLAKMEAEASKTNPVDASWLIPGADFANNDKRYELWTRNLNGGNGRSGDGGVHGSRCIESYNSGSIDFSITLNDIPNGIYHFNLQGYYRDGSRSDVVNRRNDGTETIRSFYYANNVEHPLMSILDDAKTAEGTSGYAYTEGGFYYPDSQDDANRCFNLHKGYVNDEIEVVVTTHTLKLGIKKTATSASDWTVFDNFHLTYLGPVDVSAYLEGLNAAIAEAEGLNTDNTSDKAKENLAAAIAEAKSKRTSVDGDEISQATADLQAAIDAVKAVDLTILRQTMALAATGIDLTAANNVCANALTKAEVDDALYELQTARKIHSQTFADVYTGSEPAADQEYFLYNIGTGMWLNHGSDWNTHAAVDVYPLAVKLIAADNGKFKMQTRMFKNRDEKYISWEGYVDTGDQHTWTFNPVSGKTNVYTINSEGNRTDVGRLLGYDLYAPTHKGDYRYWSNVAKDRMGVDNPNNQWKLVTRAEIEAKMNDATAATPVDVSYLIDNGGLSRVWSLDNWTKVCDGGNGGAHVTVGDDGDFNRNSDYGYEVWNANSFSFTQELTNLKPGIYNVGVSGFFRQGNGGHQASIVNNNEALISEAYLYANGEKADLPNIATEAGKLPGIFTQNSNNGTFANWPAEALKAFETGLYKTSVQAIVNSDGKLTIGVKQDQKTTDASWVLFDTFRLYYLGEEPINSMSVMGDLTGGWDFTTDKHMIQDTSNPAIWTLTIDNFDVDLQGQPTRTYEFKFTANDKYGRYELPMTGNENWVFGAERGFPEGSYKLVFTVDTENNTWTLAPICKITLDENSTTPLVAATNATVTVNRAFNQGWNAVVLPFDAEAFDGAQIAEFDTETADADHNITVTFKKADSFKANVPYLVNFPAAVAAGKVFMGVKFEPAEVKVSGTYFDFVGTYTAGEVVKAGDYVISGGQLKKASAAINLKGTRSFFQAKTSNARSLTLAFDDGTTTGISEELRVNSEEFAPVYNLNGQRVENTSKGLYIKNGKKVVIK